jgi:Tat protein translocase TatB subunit
VLLFIFESLGTSELILIGLVALIFLGPRRLPEIARKMGKMMAEFRSTASDFKQTWEREVDFEEEQKALRLDLLEEEATAKPEPVARENSILPPAKPVNAPEIKEIDKERFEALRNASAAETHNGTEQTSERDEPAEEPDLLSDKRNWL